MKPNKLLVIDGAMVSRSPHVAMYLNILNKGGVQYDVAVWNRRNDDTSQLPANYIVYDHPTNDKYPAWRKIIEIYKFYRYVIKHINKSDYGCIVIFEIANTFFFYNFLKKYFKNRYIFDIRDYSPFMKLQPARVIIRKIISNSFATVISSKGFTEWLPKGMNYVISHNIDMDIYDSLIKRERVPFNDLLHILTIGNLRDPDVNCYIAKSFANDKHYHLQFVGDGLATPIISQYCRDYDIRNVTFYGHYEKKAESSFYEKADIINCFMEDNILSNYLMSNRIYLAALLQKPIICNSGSYQSSIVDKYKLGYVINPSDKPSDCLTKYISNFDSDEYSKGRNTFLSIVKEEQAIFEEKLLLLSELS